MEKTINRFFKAAVLLITIGCFLISTESLSSQKLTHTVKKGDTLWDICETYYGDPDLWPKLWQLNSFITNPHLILPGEIITLFEKEDEISDASEEAAPEAPPVVEEEVAEPKKMGIDIERLTDVDALGFFSYEKISPWGMLFESREDKIIFGPGDIVYVLFDEDRNIKTGDIFTIGKSSSLLKNPVKGDRRGYVFSVSGSLVVEENLKDANKDIRFYEKKNAFQARIITAREPISVNDSLMPYKPFSSSCVLPISLNKEVIANIIASKGEGLILHQGSIVYINTGANEGVKRGNLFDVVEREIVTDPKPEKKITLYKRVIALPYNALGRILVVDAGPETSTAIVISASEPISAGAYIKGIQWTEEPDFLMSITNCTIE